MKLNVDDLVEQGLVKKKTYTEGIYKGLSVLKYTKKVFFKNLWHLDKRLLYCRGTVVDENDNIVVNPFKKVFNLGENNTKVGPDHDVICPVKVNGFMAAVTKTEKYGLIVSTTGTLDSEYATLARKWIDKLNTEAFSVNITLLFEICDKTDQHIIDEDEGAYLIGGHWLDVDELVSEDTLDIYSEILACKRPEVVQCKFKDLDLDVLHEGFMIRDAVSGEHLAKYKSSYYLVKKALLRMRGKRANVMFNHPKAFKQQIDEEYYDLHEFIIDKYTLEEYTSFTQDERRTIFEEYFK